jgi:hypothetical protein
MKITIEYDVSKKTTVIKADGAPIAATGILELEDAFPRFAPIIKRFIAAADSSDVAAAETLRSGAL